MEDTGLQNVFSAWGEPSADRRAEMTDAAVATDIYYSDPMTGLPVKGRDAYLDHIAGFSAGMPGGSAQVLSVSEHGGHALAVVAFLGPDGAQMMRGQYYAETEAGKITRLVGFPDAPPDKT